MKQFKSVAEFKRLLAIGDKLSCTYHLKLVGYDENKKQVYADDVRPVREVSVKQSNCFALKTAKADGTFFDSWCNYPKASDAVIKDNKLIIVEHDMRLFAGGAVNDETPRHLPKIPMMTYSFVD